MKKIHPFHVAPNWKQWTFSLLSNIFMNFFCWCFSSVTFVPIFCKHKRLSLLKLLKHVWDLWTLKLPIINQFCKEWSRFKASRGNEVAQNFLFFLWTADIIFFVVLSFSATMFKTSTGSRMQIVDFATFYGDVETFIIICI